MALLPVAPPATSRGLTVSMPEYSAALTSMKRAGRSNVTVMVLGPGWMFLA